MSNPLHSKQTPDDGIHTPVAFEYADETERLNATGFDPEDQYKFALDQDTNRLFMLIQTSPAQWVDVGNSAVTPDLNRVEVSVRKASAGSISNGQPVYVSGYDNVNDVPLVEVADADDYSKMPAIGLADGTITDGSDGHVLVVGQLNDLNTSGFSVNDAIYVGASAGTFVSSPPAYPAIIQALGVVLEVSGSNEGRVAVNPQSFRALSLSVSPSDLGSTGIGTSQFAARADHVHAHGNQGGGSEHSNATTSTDGFMSSADKTKLDADGEAAGQVLSTTATDTSEWTDNPKIRAVDFESGLPDPSQTEGRLFYDDTHKCLSFYNDEANIQLQIGQETWVRVWNDTGSPILEGNAVYISGADASEELPTIAKAQADDPETAEVIGVTTHDIGNEEVGYVCTLGTVHFLDTSSYTNGSPLFLSATTPGGLTDTEPSTPNLSVRVGYVTDSATDPDGTILVSPKGPQEDSGVVSVSPNDSVSDYLLNKLIGGSAISVTEVNDGGNEDLEIDVSEVDDTQHGDRGGGSLHSNASVSEDGFMSASDKSKLNGVEAGAKDDQTIIAGDGLTGGGTGDVTVDAVGNADGSIIVNANDIQVGTINDGQHGNRGGGSLHANATQSANGFMSSADKTKLDGLSIPVFGQNYQFEKSDSQSQTNSSGFQAKVQMVTPSLPSGTYLLNWAAKMANNYSRGEVQLWDSSASTQLDLSSHEGRGNNIFASMSGMAQVTFSGPRTFEIRYRSAGGGTQYIQNARITIWRVS